MVEVSYGDGRLKLEVPPGRFRLVRPQAPAGAADALPAFQQSLRGPMGCPPLEELSRGKRVAYLVEDATRSEPRGAFMQACLARLGGARFVAGLVATGSHERMSEGNLRIVEQFKMIARREGIRSDVTIHDCDDAAFLKRLGVTARGTPVEASARMLECDVVLVSADMKNHYFAGYCSALKDFLPGICSYRAIEANHSLALDPRSTFGVHPLHPDPSRRDNPLAQDILEAAELIRGGRPAFVLASVWSPGGVLWSAAGEMRQVTVEGIRKVDEVASRRARPSSRVILSPGGHPNDETLYNAQRGLELARNVISEGAEVLLAAACPKGVAPTARARENFFDRLAAPLDEVLGSLEERYVLYSHKAYKFASLLKKLGRVYMFTELDEKTVSAAHMSKVRSPQRVVDEWLKGSDEPILIVDEANRLALYPDGP